MHKETWKDVLTGCAVLMFVMAVGMGAQGYIAHMDDAEMARRLGEHIRALERDTEAARAVLDFFDHREPDPQQSRVFGGR